MQNMHTENNKINVGRFRHCNTAQCKKNMSGVSAVKNPKLLSRTTHPPSPAADDSFGRQA